MRAQAPVPPLGPALPAARRAVNRAAHRRASHRGDAHAHHREPRRAHAVPRAGDHGGGRHVLRRERHIAQPHPVRQVAAPEPQRVRAGRAGLGQELLDQGAHSYACALDRRRHSDMRPRARVRLARRGTGRRGGAHRGGQPPPHQRHGHGGGLRRGRQPRGRQERVRAVTVRAARPPGTGAAGQVGRGPLHLGGVRRLPARRRGAHARPPARQTARPARAAGA